MFHALDSNFNCRIHIVITESVILWVTYFHSKKIVKPTFIIISMKDIFRILKSFGIQQLHNLITYHYVTYEEAISIICSEET